jgi:uncharacterized protein (TIGR00369 family)
MTDANGSVRPKNSPMTERVTRTYDYARPTDDMRNGAAIAGLEGLRRMLRGELPPPPITDTLGFTLVEVERGRAVFTGTPAEWQYNPLGSVHGGWVATVLDSALGCAVHTMLDGETGYTTVDLQVRFLRPIFRTTGVLRAEGTVVHAGNKVATAEGKLVGGDKIFATATASCLILRPERRT